MKMEEKEKRCEGFTGSVISFYDTNGEPDQTRPKYQYNMLNGLIDGEYKEWWNNGVIRYIIQYKSNGKQSIRDGRFTSFNMFGQIVSQRVYSQGREII